MTHAHAIQFFKDLGECPLARIAMAQSRPVPLEPLWFEKADSHPIFSVTRETDESIEGQWFCDAMFMSNVDLLNHRWSIWLSLRTDETQWDEWAVAWRVMGSTRQEALDLAWAKWGERMDLKVDACGNVAVADGEESLRSAVLRRLGR
jgi:hypothetical protein